MRTLLISTCLAIFCLSAAIVHAGEKIALKTAEGVWYHWDDYYEANGSYCHFNGDGEICIPKKEIVKVMKGDKATLPEQTKFSGKGKLKEVSVEEAGELGRPSDPPGKKEVSPDDQNNKDDKPAYTREQEERNRKHEDLAQKSASELRDWKTKRASEASQQQWQQKR